MPPNVEMTLIKQIEDVFASFHRRKSNPSIRTELLPRHLHVAIKDHVEARLASISTPATLLVSRSCVKTESISFVAYPGLSLKSCKTSCTISRSAMTPSSLRTFTCNPLEILREWQRNPDCQLMSVTLCTRRIATLELPLVSLHHRRGGEDA